MLFLFYCQHTYNVLQTYIPYFHVFEQGLTALPGLAKSNFGQNALIDIKYIA